MPTSRRFFRSCGRFLKFLPLPRANLCQVI
jgi:hypothetical protein